MTETLGQRLKARRKSYGLTRNEMEPLTGLSMRVIQCVEEGRAHTWKNIVSIGYVLSFDLKQLSDEVIKELPLGE